MATASEAPTLFLRKATGLVKGWNTFDAFVYSFLSVNLVTLGLYSLIYASGLTLGQSWLSAVLLTGLFVTFLVIAYAGMISVMPRAGGDYVWQSRVLSGGVAFVLAVTGWWFILWQWTPIYANILAVQFFQPLLIVFHHPGTAAWFTTNNGIFVTCLITAVLAGFFVSLGMEGYAKVQKYSFYGGGIGLLIMFLILLFGSKSGFASAFNTEAAKIFGDKGDAYTQTITAAKGAGVLPSSGLGFGPIGPVFLLIPLVAFFLLWPNWGATLYGEVRGASDFKRVFRGMFSGLWVCVAFAVLFFLLAAKTFGWTFYMSAQNDWFNVAAHAPAASTTVWPYPALLAGYYTHNQVFMLILVLLMSLWFIGWAGTLFLSSTRVIFAAAFDRVLPEWAANVSERRHVPFGALTLMLVPSIIVSAIYAYSSSFRHYTYDATLVIAVTFLGTAFAAMILPWRKKALHENSPIAKYKVGGIPLITVAGTITFAFLLFNLIQWFKHDGYFVNDKGSLIWMGILYGLALLIYVAARLIRRRQGVDLSRIHAEIPVE